MLVLSRKKDEAIKIGEGITIHVVDIGCKNVRIGIEAPESMSIHRQEVFDSIKKNGPINQEIRG